MAQDQLVLPHLTKSGEVVNEDGTTTDPRDKEQKEKDLEMEAAMKGGIFSKQQLAERSYEISTKNELRRQQVELRRMRLDGSKINYLTEFKEERQRSQNYSNKRLDMKDIVSRALMMK